MDMDGETLPAGSSVTVTKTTSPEGNLLFVIGVPQGIQGDKGDTGETGATGPQGVSVTNATVNEDGDLVITLSAGDPINAGSVIGPRGIQGDVGPTGASVDHIDRTSGTGAPGTTDTYTVYLTNGQTGGTFQVYNGSNGTGSGDFMSDGSVPMTGALQMGGHAVTGMADGTDPTDGATVGQLAGKLDSPDGGTAGQVLTRTADGSAWEDAPSGLPDGGVEGQVIKKTADGAEWDDAEWLPLSGGTMSGNVDMSASLYPNDRWILLNGKENGNRSAGIRFMLDADGKTIIVRTELASIQVQDSGSDGYVSINSGRTSISGLVSPTENSDAVPLGYLNTQLSTKLTTPTGTQGQLLGFTEDNVVGAVDKPESGLTQSEADERYLQLTGGTIEVDALSTALTLKNTKSTGAVSDVNRSPYLNFETGNGKVVNEYIDFGSGRAAVAFYDVENDDFVAITGLLDPVYGSDAANKAYVDSKSPTSVTVTLTTSGWSSNTQTVTVSGVSATETAQLITPTPAIASQSAYYEAGIMCTGQAANSLTFTCQTVPTSNLTVYVVIQPLN